MGEEGERAACGDVKYSTGRAKTFNAVGHVMQHRRGSSQKAAGVKVKAIKINAASSGGGLVVASD